MKKVFGQIGRLKPECIEEYRRLHEVDVYTERWAGVLALIHDCNLQNYSIFIEDDVVFGYFEYVGEDYEADMEKMDQDEETQRWWTFTKPCFEKFAIRSDSEFYADMKQIFYFE